MSYKTIIIDDDLNGINAIINLFDQFDFPAEVVGTAQTIEEGIPQLNQHQPDLLFLDIEMKNESGFDLLEIWDSKNTKVIFCTGYDQYAIKALKNGAYDYILKPLDYKEFMALFKKLDEESVENEEKSESTEKEEAKAKLTIKSPGGVYLIDFCEINFLKADGRYTQIHYDNEKECTSSQNLGSLEETLECADFQRINKSLIINRDRLKGVEKRGAKSFLFFVGGELEVTDGIRKSTLKLLE